MIAQETILYRLHVNEVVHGDSADIVASVLENPSDYPEEYYSAACAYQPSEITFSTDNVIIETDKRLSRRFRKEIESFQKEAVYIQMIPKNLQREYAIGRLQKLRGVRLDYAVHARAAIKELTNIISPPGSYSPKGVKQDYLFDVERQERIYL